MRNNTRIKTPYIIATILWIFFAVIVLIYNISYGNISSGDLSSLIFTSMGVFITLLSIAIADRKKLKYGGKVIAWINKTDTINVNNDTLTPLGTYIKTTFKIDNYSKHDINSLNVNIRIPSKIFYRAHSLEDFLTCYEFKNTLILSSSKMKYLGSTKGDSDLIFEQYFNFDAWPNDRVLYITIAGENIIPTTFKIDLLQKKELMMSSSDKPIKLTQV
jgi:hypothetical protein